MAGRCILTMIAVLAVLRSGPADDAVFASRPKLLLDSGAGEAPPWHPELGLLMSGDGNINRFGRDGRHVVRLTRLARARMSAKLLRRVDPEDVVQVR